MLALTTAASGHGANTLKVGAYRRPFHAKAHGYVMALFNPTVDLSKHEGVGGDAGIFNPAKSEYQAVIRFSNAKGEMLADTEDDLKGFAMRIFDVEGPRLRSTLTGHRRSRRRVERRGSPFDSSRTDSHSSARICNPRERHCLRGLRLQSLERSCRPSSFGQYESRARNRVL
jgi:hypothetical protein